MLDQGTFTAKFKPHRIFLFWSKNVYFIIILLWLAFRLQPIIVSDFYGWFSVAYLMYNKVLSACLIRNFKYRLCDSSLQHFLPNTLVLQGVSLACALLSSPSPHCFRQAIERKTKPWLWLRCEGCFSQQMKTSGMTECSSPYSSDRFNTAY